MIKRIVRQNEIHGTIDANYFKGRSNQRAAIAVLPHDKVGGGSSWDDKHSWDTYMINGKIRRLTPTECERLMSWPDSHTKYGIDEKRALKDSKGYYTLEERWTHGFLKFFKKKVRHNRPVVLISDSQRYKMAGNGVVSSVVRELVKGLNLN